MPQDVAALVRRAAEVGADRPALCWRDQVISWGDLDARVDMAAAGLRALDLPHTGGYAARVAIALPNTPEFAVALFGVLRAGLIAVPVNPGFTTRELRHVLQDSGAGALIGTHEVLAAVPRADVPGVRLLDETPRGDGDGAPGQPDGLAVLLYTSGTSGQPKGAMLSHRALVANHEQVTAVQPPIVRRDDVALLALPLFHAYGLNSGLGAVAYHAACGVLAERFDPVETLALIQRHRVTVVVGVPPMYVAWAHTPDVGTAMASVRIAISGAAPLEPAAAARFTTATSHQIFEGYGLTETAPALTSTLVGPAPKSGSIGRPFPGVEMRLVAADGADVWRSDGSLTPDDEDDTDPELDLADPGSDPGEIVVRGANLFSGYWPDGREGPDAEGWWATGDIAYADSDGDLFLVDRLGELILVNGFNVYPHEVEQVLEAHDRISEAAVLGVVHPATGQTVKAYVVRADPGLTVGDVLAYCEKNLARFKCPTAVEFVDTLPHSATGKVRKGELRRG